MLVGISTLIFVRSIKRASSSINSACAGLLVMAGSALVSSAHTIVGPHFGGQGFDHGFCLARATISFRRGSGTAPGANSLPMTKAGVPVKPSAWASA